MDRPSRTPRVRHGIAALVAAACIALSLGPAQARGNSVLVFAAASLKDALDDVAAKYERETGDRAVISYAASSTLAKQIEAGAPADVFISADLDWMDYLAQRKLVAAPAENLLGNELVLIAPAGSVAKVAIAPGFPLASLLDGGKLAMADTAAVPAGKYGKAALEKLGVWPSVAGGIAQAENVRAALALVARKEALFGIVYETDAAVEPRVKVVGVFPAETHPPIVYPMARVAGSTNAAAAPFLRYLASPDARPLFEKQGFTVLE